jgi:YidC/Oxa1 family membrane protein insertase
MINVLIVLSTYVGGLGISIIFLTIIIRAVMYPLSMKQLHASKKMQDLQVQIAELRKKYSKDRQAMAREQMRLYKEAGMNPAGCVLPMLIQTPIWIALYQSIVRVLAAAPEDFLGLSQHLYKSWPVFSSVPLPSQFLWLDLAAPDKFLLLPILVGGTMWLQQKMMTPTVQDEKSAAQSQMMLWMMPLMFAFLTLSFPSGLALYWVVSNIISIVMQYFVTGWGGLKWSFLPGQKKTTGQVIKPRSEETRSKAPARIEEPKAKKSKSEAALQKRLDEQAREEVSGHGESGSQRQDRRRGGPTGPGPTRRKPGTGGDKGTQGG